MKTKTPESKIAVEKALVERIKNGTSAEREIAFAELFKVYKSIILQKMLVGVFYDKELAKDLMMDVFIKVSMKIGSYDSNEGAFSTWIHTIAKNCLIDHKRAEKYEVLSIEELNNSVNHSGSGDRETSGDQSFTFQIADTSIDTNGFEAAVKKERAVIAREAIDAIKNVNIREVIKLRFLEDISYGEISIRMGIPEGSVKAYVNRGKAEMKEFISSNTKDFSFK